jgi:RNA polymerase sigma factor (sigma-70 family)
MEQFEVGHKRIAKNVEKYIHRKVRDYDAACDVCQNTWLYMLERLEKIEYDRIEQYAIRCAHYRILDHLNEDRGTVSIDEKKLDLEDTRINNYVLEYHDMLNALDANVRQVVDLYLMHYSHAEICEITGLQYQTVKNYLHDARIKLSEINHIAGKY